MNRAELVAALDAGDFDRVVGATESVDVEFKRTHYRLDDARQQFELAKDVSALANTPTGGVLVLGFATDQPPGVDADTVVEATPVARADFNRDAYTGRVQSLVYPQITGLNAEFKPSRDDDSVGAVLITVPPQSEADRYFIVAKRMQGPDDAPGWLVGVAVRSLDVTHHLEIAQIHGLMNRGRTMSGRIDEIHALVSALHADGVGAAAPEREDALPQKVDAAIDAFRRQNP